MVIDDSKIILNRLVPMIQELPNVSQVLQGTNFEQGKAILEKIKINVAAVDINLPGKSGLDLLYWIRANDIKLDLIIVMTEDPSEGKEDLSFKLGASYFIDKFYEPEKIIDLIAHFGHRAGQTDNNESPLPQ